MDRLSGWFEIARGGAGHNVRPMEGLRGLAVFLVFLVHYVTLVQPWLGASTTLRAMADTLHAMGNLGVDLFFVLSGYLIYGSLMERPQPFLKFISRRLERLYPAFIPVFVTYVVLSWLFPAESKVPREAWAATLYLAQNFFLLPGLFPIEPMITVAWSLSYEMFYYLLIPVVIAVLRLRERSARWRIAFFVMAALSFAICCAAIGGWLGTDVRLIMFVSGILLHEAMQLRGAPAPSSSIGLLALAAALAAMPLPLQGNVGFAVKICILFVAFFVLCLACFRTPHGWLAVGFSWTPARWLGNMSYSYYLLHGLILKGAFWMFARLVPAGDYGSGLFWVLLPLMFGTTLAPSAALFIGVERPFSLVRRPAKAQLTTERPPTLV
ncbi:MAG: acyltransferase [Bryobacterales bacterium]|nr:acyltransferase [Bryobacterales bacterium]